LVTVIAAFVVRGAFVAQGAHAMINCNRGVAYPYQQLLARMRQLAEAGEAEQLRALIIRAHDRSGELTEACMEQKEDGIYAAQVRELTQ
jgi:3-deoxy-D-manno-octulosonic acid (KDO) 8-phosphate synthase